MKRKGQRKGSHEKKAWELRRLEKGGGMERRRRKDGGWKRIEKEG